MQHGDRMCREFFRSVSQRHSSNLYPGFSRGVALRAEEDFRASHRALLQALSGRGYHGGYSFNSRGDLVIGTNDSDGTYV
eukprot:c16329_g1_i1 orf=163-402(+)